MKTSAQQKLQSEVDAAVRAFSQKIAEQSGGVTGIPKPPVIEVSEAEFEPGKFIAEVGATQNAATSSGRGGGPDDCPECPDMSCRLWYSNPVTYYTP